MALGKGELSGCVCMYTHVCKKVHPCMCDIHLRFFMQICAQVHSYMIIHSEHITSVIQPPTQIDSSRRAGWVAAWTPDHVRHISTSLPSTSVHRHRQRHASESPQLVKINELPFGRQLGGVTVRWHAKTSNTVAPFTPAGVKSPPLGGLISFWGGDGVGATSLLCSERSGTDLPPASSACRATG